MRMLRLGPLVESLQRHGVVVDAHVASAHQHVVAHVDVDGVARWGLQALGGRGDVGVEVAHMVAAVEVIGPERTIGKVDVLHGDVARTRDVNQSGALLILVGALGIPLAAQPKLAPIVVAVAVDGAGTGDDEAVEAVGVDEGGVVGACLTLDACGAKVEVGYAVGAFQPASLLHLQVGALAEIQTA